MKKLVGLIAVVLLSTGSSAEEIKLSRVGIPARQIGKDWTGPTGLVIDDIDFPPKVPDEAKEVVAWLWEQLKPIGVTACADFTYAKKADVGHQVTVRVYLFRTPGQCQEWIKKKYQFDGWEKHYKRVEGNGSVVYDSLEMRKRCIAFDRVWITAGTIAKADDHIKFFELYLARLRKLTGTSASQPARSPRSRPVTTRASVAQ